MSHAVSDNYRVSNTIRLTICQFKFTSWSSVSIHGHWIIAVDHRPWLSVQLITKCLHLNLNYWIHGLCKPSLDEVNCKGVLSCPKTALRQECMFAMTSSWQIGFSRKSLFSFKLTSLQSISSLFDGICSFFHGIHWMESIQFTEFHLHLKPDDWLKAGDHDSLD